MTVARKFVNENQEPVDLFWVELWAVFFQYSVLESDYERKRNYKLVESIRESANTIHNFFDAMEEKEVNKEDVNGGGE